VGEVNYTLCARLLDQGAMGIILPRVEDPAILEEALSWLRFPPMGKRGFGINPTMVDMRPTPCLRSSSTRTARSWR